VSASHYERDRHCFSARTELSGVCALPVGCPGGGGDIACLARDGDVYAGYLLFGEQLSNPAWHHDSDTGLDSTLTMAEQKVCDELRQKLQVIQDGPDAGTIVVDSSLGVTTIIAPACTD
jgi:hypothetical protein